MIRANAKVTSTMDRTSQIRNINKSLAGIRVLIGIPENTEREGSDTKLTNAQLLFILSHGVREISMRDEMQPNLDQGIPYSKAMQLYIHEHGSPLWQVPPRPVLEPAIASVKAKVAERLKNASAAMYSGEDAKPYLNQAGIIGMNAARGWFTNPKNGWPPNAESTIKAKGSDRPMIDTGQMRNAITYVVRDS